MVAECLVGVSLGGRRIEAEPHDPLPVDSQKPLYMYACSPWAIGVCAPQMLSFRHRHDPSSHDRC